MPSGSCLPAVCVTSDVDVERTSLPAKASREGCSEGMQGGGGGGATAGGPPAPPQPPPPEEATGRPPHRGK
jgi:hypothetical protein